MLAKLAPLFTGEARAQALAQRLDAALAIEDGWHRVTTGAAASSPSPAARAQAEAPSSP